VAISRAKRTLLIGIKGTSTLEDLITDCCGRAVRVDLENDPHCGPVMNAGNAGGNDNDSDTVAGTNGGVQGDDELGDAARMFDEVELEPEERRDDGRRDYVPNDKDEAKLKMDNQIDVDGVEPHTDENNYIPVHDETPSTLHSPSTNSDLASMVHVSACNGFFSPSDSVEVELVRDGQKGSISYVDSSHDSTFSKPHQQQQPDTSRAKKTSPTRSIPSSENVLIFPLLTSGTRRSSTINQQDATTTSPPEIFHSPTDEFMESHGIEMEENRSHKLRGVHEGILHCAQQLFFEIAPLVEEYAISKGYDVILTGHSLGASTAVLLAVLIRGRYPLLTVPNRFDGTSNDDGAERRSDEFNIGQRVRAYAFAPPPVLDRGSALACRHYVTSIVNNSDIVPRSSMTNLDVLLTVLEAVRRRLVEAGMNPGSSSGGGSQSSITSAVALFCKLSEGAEGDLLLDPAELQNVLEEAVAEASLGDGENDGFYWDEEFNHHLFVPGKLLMLHEPWSCAITKTTDDGIGISKEENGAGSPRSWPNKEGANDGQRDGDEMERSSRRVFHAMWTDGMDPALKGFEVGAGSGMATDHLTTSYDHALALLEGTSCA